MDAHWKANWSQTRERLVKWWQQEGLVVTLMPPRDAPLDGIRPPPAAADLRSHWLDAEYRSAAAEADLAGKVFLAEAFPYIDTHIGPGSLSLILGSQAHFDWETVWYQPCIADPESSGPIIARLDEHNPWWQAHLALIDAGLRRAQGRFLVGMPDLIEGLDTLAALRGTSETLYDLTERPGWVYERLAQINQAWFAVFDALYQRIHDPVEGGNAFSFFQIWGPGKTAKLQCDFSAMISPKMFARFVTPYLTEQCEWLDYAMYHLDGTNARQHLDALLSIPRLNAIEWTPQAGKPGGGSPEWYDLYRRIKGAGKSVQAVDVTLSEVIPLLDAVGPRGMFLMLADGYSRAEAENLLKQLEPYYAEGA